MLINLIPDNAVIEWHAEFASIRTGIVSNLPPQRHIGRVVAHKAGYLLVVDPDAVRCRVRPEQVSAVLAERAEAGWGRL
jgi:hypothetical protein